RLPAGPPGPDELTICGVRPGMLRSEVDRELEGLEEGVYLWPEPRRHVGCHCECPRVYVEFDSRGRVARVRGPQLERNGWRMVDYWDSIGRAERALNRPLHPEGVTLADLGLRGEFGRDDRGWRAREWTLVPVR
ncbi:MAG: hypothetical protein AB1758_22205, partial [Candidatus Eremiobacterota bacterium]